MKIVFMGTPDFAVPALKALTKYHDVVCVYTQAPKEAGRGQQLTKSAVHNFAEEQGILVRTPKTLRNEDTQAEFKELQADIAVVAAYGLIIPKPVLEAYKYGCINIHASLLPKWRGAAPIQRAIQAGDNKSGVTIMQVAEGLDTGDMLLKGEIPITVDTTGGILHDGLAEIGARLVIEYLKNIDEIIPEAQSENGTCYAAKIDKTECKLDFSLSAESLERKIRAFNPYPATYFEHNNERFKVFKAKVVDFNGGAGEIIEGEKRLIIACGDNALEIMEIQRQGKKAMPTSELLKSMKF